MIISYKIYYNDSFVLLTNEHPQSNKKFTKVFTGAEESSLFFRNSLQLFDSTTNENILVVCDNPTDVWKNLMKNNEVVPAGGGIVTNETGELLLIHRRGKWDLPKGKIERNEKIIAGAEREVEEETGVKIKSVNETPTLTYHAYKLKGKNCIKETSWYEMKAKEGQQKLMPQTEEDIDEVRWVNPVDLKKYQEGCYMLIWDLLAKFA